MAMFSPFDISVDEFEADAFAFKAGRGSNPDTLSWDEAMAEIDSDKRIEAALTEIRVLEKNDTWTNLFWLLLPTDKY